MRLTGRAAGATNVRGLVATATLPRALFFFLFVFLSLTLRGNADGCADAARHEWSTRELARGCN